MFNLQFLCTLIVHEVILKSKQFFINLKSAARRILKKMTS